MKSNNLVVDGLLCLLAFQALLTISQCFDGIPDQDSESSVPRPNVYSLHITSDIMYRYANTLVTSRVVNPANIAQEVNFHVVLPEDAFITRFVMIINEKEYEAYVKEKEVAKAEYNEAVMHGQSAAHISARDSNEFTVAINIEASSKVTFNLTYEQFLERTLSSYKHEIHVNPGQIVKDMVIEINIEDVAPITHIKVPELRLTNEIQEEEDDSKIAKIEPISPEKVKITWAPSVEEQTQLAAEGIKGHFVVLYDIDRSQNPQQILIDDGYFVHFFANDDLPPLNKHVVFILDISGSMHGRKLQQVKDAMKKILSDLNVKDYFSIVLFSDRAKAWAPNKTVTLDYVFSLHEVQDEEITNEYVVEATQSNIQLATDFINKLDDLGGTNIIAGLRMGIKLTKIGNELLKDKKDHPEPIIIFLTDGEPNVEMSDPNEIRKTATSMNTLRSAIFSLGFGDGADMKFLRNLSLANSGFARSIYEGADATLQLKNFFKEVASPLLSNVNFKYLPGQVENDTTNVYFNTFFSGSEMVVAGKLINPDDFPKGVIIARSPEGVQEIPFPDIRPIIIDHIPRIPTPKNRTFGHLERMWAYKSIHQLLDKNLVEQDENLKKEALQLALKYSFVTPLTSMVVVKPNETEAVNAEKSKLTRSFGVNFAPPSASFAYSMSRSPAFPLTHRTKTTSGIVGPPGFYHTTNFPHPPSLMAAPSDIKYESAMNIHSGIELDSELTPILEPSEKSYKNYSEVLWLANQPATPDGKFLSSPVNISLSELIALFPDTTTKVPCNVDILKDDGNDHYCYHFVDCVLEEFLENSSNYIPYKCQIEPHFLGVCCPTNPKTTTVYI